MSDTRPLKDKLKNAPEVTSLANLNLLAANVTDGSLSRMTVLSLRCYILFGINTVQSISRTTSYDLSSINNWLNNSSMWWSEIKSTVPAGIIVIFSATMKDTGQPFHIFHLTLDATRESGGISYRLMRTLAIEVEGYPMIWASYPTVANTAVGGG